ncbi:MAG: DUF721 domain-containing protein [bacterium]
MDFEDLNSALRSAINELGLERKIKERKCLSIWEEVVGDKLASVSQAEDIKNGVLYASAKDPIWAQEIFNLKGLIIKRINERMGEEIIKDIKVRAKPIKKRERKEREKEEREEELDEELLKEIDRIAGKVEDERMRSLVRSTLENYFKAKIDRGKRKA